MAHKVQRQDAYLKSLSWVLFLLGLNILFTLGCTSSGSNNATISISIPQSSNRSSSANQINILSSYDASLTPTSFSQLNCFFVFVSGPESNMSNNSCSLVGGTNIPVGVAAGSFSPGSTSNIAVPAGSNRTISIIGLETDGTVGCPSLANFNSVQSHLSNPVFLGSTSGLNLSADQTTSVNIPVTATLQANNALSASGCNGPLFNNGSGGGSAFSFGTGVDGALSVMGTYYTSTALSSDGKPFNAMSRVSSITASNAVSLWSGGGSNFLVGQEVMITLIAANYVAGDSSNASFAAGISSPGPDNICGGGWSRGRYMFTHISNVSSDALTFADAFTDGTSVNSIAVSQTVLSGGKSFCDFRVVRVPNFLSVTQNMGCSPIIRPPSGGFDPTLSPATNMGLFVVFRVSGTMSLACNQNGVSVSGNGFLDPSYVTSGYGVAGGGTAVGVGPLGNGGGVFTFGGAGGANAGTGGADANGDASTMANTWCSGPCLPDQKVFGGGAGGGSNQTSSYLGGNGGGIIMVFANTISSTAGGNFTADATGGSGSVTLGSGGGAGGTVLVVANTVNTTSALGFSAVGGASVNTGGGGGGGAIQARYCTNSNVAPVLIASNYAGGIGGSGAGTGGAGVGALLPNDSGACNATP